MWLPLSLLLLVTILDQSEGTASDSYITYHEGTLPIIIGAPHGGTIKPDEVPNRDAGCWDGDKCTYTHTCGDKDSSKCKATTVRDMNTKELALLMRDELYDLYNEYPHVIVCELHRSKMDANRVKDQATFGVASMEEAWTQFHTYINRSKANSFPQASLYIDVHGHGHPLQYAELGYLIKGNLLDNNEIAPEGTSIRRLAGKVEITFEELLRGKQSFGGILEDEGYEAVPSFNKPRPNGNPYFSGGENTKIHGSRSGGNTDAIQIESPRTFRSAAIRPAYAKALAKTIQKYMKLHYGFTGGQSDEKRMTPEEKMNMSAAGRHLYPSVLMLFVVMCNILRCSFVL